MNKHKTKLIKKPFLTLAVMVFIVAAIIFIQSRKAQPAQINSVVEKEKPAQTFSVVEKEKESKFPKAPNFIGIDRWINSEPLKIEQLKGKVVLVDFWTYTCINCIRTLPYLKEWDKKYRDEGLVIVGVHTPEFEFEKKYENVLKAVNDYEIKYPVAQDNNYATWSAFQNRYWPHEFLIDIDGYIRHDHIGEGNYEETEKTIQELLKERVERLNNKNIINESISKPSEASVFEFQKIGTPEIYFGYQFTRGNIGYDSIPQDSVADYNFPKSASKNFVYLSGKWKNNADNMELASDEGSILLIFEAKKINIVAGSENSSDAYVLLDNKNESISKIKEYKLYNLASAENYDTHAININIKGKGFRIYTFTFG